MNTVIDRLENRYPSCSRDSCGTPNCELHLDGFPSEKVILDIDCVAHEASITGKRCDYIIVVCENDSIFLLSVEFKTTRVIPNDVWDQMKGGIAFFKHHHGGDFKFRPVLVSQRLSRRAGNELKKMRISHGKKTLRIRHIPCNESLSWHKVKN